MTRRKEIGEERKVEFVKQYKAGKISQEEGAKEAGVHPESFRQWIKRYESEGISGFYRGGKNRTYDISVKMQAVEEYLRGKGSQLEICKRYQIRSKTQLQGWIKVYNGMKVLRYTKFISARSLIFMTAVLLPMWSANETTIPLFSRPLTGLQRPTPVRIRCFIATEDFSIPIEAFTTS